MKAFSIFQKFADLIFNIIKVLMAIMITVMVIITTMEVIRRYIFGLSFIWAEELVKFMLVAVTFLGGPAAYRSGSLAFLDLAVSHLGDKGKKAVSIFINVVIIISCIWLAKLGFEYSFSPMVAKMYSTGLKLKMTYIYLTIPIGFCMMIVFAIEQILMTVFNIEPEAKEA
ncbi:MAG: TRAP transporter small permease [Lachnospiraceae bacterium]|nr:TRAP transporter small permease [Lachnospiraceae bacterium]